MARKTKAQREYESAQALDAQLLERLQGIIADPQSPGYVTVKAISAASGIIERRERRRDEWFSALADKPVPYYNVLPDNGRGGPPRG
jgi:hypothetical protein